MSNTLQIAARLDRVREAMRQASAEALLVTQPENRGYLSGFTGSTAVLLITAERLFIATDSRYYEQSTIECPDFELVPVTKSFLDTLPELIAGSGAKQVAFESDHVTFADAQAWMAAVPGVEWLPTKGMVGELRAIKDEMEIQALRDAIALGDEALMAGLAQARPGMQEVELAWIIESYMRTHGAEGIAFDLIIAGGPNGARPHARASTDPLEAGVPIVIDMGAQLRGYCSDLTRTVCLGQPRDPDRFWTVYNTVLRAQTAAEAAIRPGMIGSEVDQVARAVIIEAGFGENFGHGLGHGVGRVVHEQPSLGRVSTSVLRPGMVATVEPGIYLPGWGGVRIEDIVLITENGAEVLSSAPKDPII